MSANPSQPHLPGYLPRGYIGKGGFSRVYRYHQQRTDRTVAVKILDRDALGAESGEEFVLEARVMGNLSTHPNILTIHDAGTLPDGRPFLAMELCPEPDLMQQISAGAPLSVTRTLRTGILIAGAVESVHQAGVLHRDIKPANILISDYQEPMLSDFGISARAMDARDDRSSLSMPWAALEEMEGTDSSELSDVHSLAATLYTLLTGRWPFAVEGGRNEWGDLLARMRSQPPAPIGRGDVPAELESLLHRAMSPRPQERPASAIEFAKQLRAIDVPGWRPPEAYVRGRTHHETQKRQSGTGLLRPPAREDAGIVAVRPAAARPVPLTPIPLPPASPTQRRVPNEPAGLVSPIGPPPPGDDVPEAEATLARPPVAPEQTPAPQRGRLVVAGVCALTAFVAVGFLLLGDDPDDPVPPASATSSAPDPVMAAPQTPRSRQWKVSGADLVLAWTAPGRENGDTYLWRVTEGGDNASHRTDLRSVTLPGAAKRSKVCVSIQSERSGSYSQPLTTCWP